MLIQGNTPSVLKVQKNIPIKVVDDKRQVTATFAVSGTGEFVRVHAGKVE